MFNKITSNRAIHAKIAEFEFTDPTILKDGRWSTFFDFHIIGDTEKTVHNERIYMLVCSSSFKSNPSGEVVNEKTLVLDFLDKEHVRIYAQAKIDMINDLRLSTWQEYYMQLECYFDIDD